MANGVADYGEGYVVDVAYTDRYHPGLAPLDLAFAAVLNGVVPPDVDGSFSFLDLGCGNGFHASLVAAACPQAEVWGADFNPAHIRNAQATAASADLRNVRFVEESFASLADRELPPFDMVVAHGIWSWVSADNRDRIVALLARVVKPGGLVMMSYNCHPGWDALVPLRELLLAAAQDVPDPGQRVEHALAIARGLRDAGADYFRDNPGASTMVDQLADADGAYVAHEYFNANWTLFHPQDVATALAPAGLRRIASARAIDAFDDLWLTDGERALVARESGSAAALLRDLILNRRFRLDVFARDGAANDQAAVERWYAKRRFVLARARADCSLAFRTRPGETVLPADPAATLLDLLASGPQTGAALAAAVIGNDAPAVNHTLARLVATGNVRLALPEAGESARRAATRRFNAAALGRARMGEAATALASPVTGAGEPVSEGDQLMLDAVAMGIPVEAISTGDDADAVRFRELTLPALTMLGIA